MNVRSAKENTTSSGLKLQGIECVRESRRMLRENTVKGGEAELREEQNKGFIST